MTLPATVARAPIDPGPDRSSRPTVYFRQMRTSAWFGCSMVVLTVVLAGILKIFGHPSNWVLGALLALAFVPIGFMLGCEDPSPGEGPGIDSKTKSPNHLGE